ncbi:MAG TPA: aminodeoxychorismate/anthranilate synthase component II [Cytophagaceae bacterium]|jgi:anthranilate synthase/aminodeoxychorismate synthase-like glutamine amidotransferase|nr:aminodeoxychorismate/anthranilate synthase component II [Cytophagaceae bacterium]
MILLLDNFDSFTYNLQDYLYQIGLNCEVIRNDVPIEKIILKDYQAVVFSPGPGKPEVAGNLMALIDYYHDKLPILGICLGHQALAAYFGASVRKAKYPMHGKISLITCYPDPIFNNIPDHINVVRYHSLITENLPPALKVLAHTPENEIMAFRHISLPIYGLQFHPEAILTECGLQLLKNWSLTTYTEN